MLGIDFPEVIVIFGLALVVLGPKKLPGLAAQVGRWLGRARLMARQFREQLEQEVQNAESALDIRKNSTPPPPAVQPTPYASPPAAPEAPASEAPSSAAESGATAASASPGSSARFETSATHSALWTDPGMDEAPAVGTTAPSAPSPAATSQATTSQATTSHATTSAVSSAHDQTVSPETMLYAGAGVGWLESAPTPPATEAAPATPNGSDHE